MPADKELQKTVLHAHQQRCAECHVPETVSRLDWIDLKEPAKSRFLVAPLSGACGKTIYADQNDPDYEILRKAVEDAVMKALQYPRRDVEALLEEWNFQSPYYRR
jgi:mono/diheme cytochrome c family protein